MSATAFAPFERSVLDRAAPGRHFTEEIEGRDFLDRYLPLLSDAQRRTLLAWAAGRTCRQIAAAEHLSEKGVEYRVRQGLLRLRELAASDGH